jgi:membrane fusion protein (multidrug efflux system)
LNFATIKAPFDGIIDHQIRQHGSLISEGDELTTLSDNSVMWVYFNVPEARYLEYKASKDNDDLKVELVLANGKTFPAAGKIGAIEADFNNETGNIAFRADFPNAEGLLRHGQTGTIHISRLLKNAVVIPQRATYEILAKKYVYVVGDEAPASSEGHDGHSEKPVVTKVSNETKDAGHADHGSKEHAATEHAAGEHGAEHSAADEKHGVARQREIVIYSELDDIYLIKDGIGVNDKIVLEGVRQARDGQKLKYEFLAPEKALSNLKHHAE